MNRAGHLWACPGHPRLFGAAARKTWMPDTRPGMTVKEITPFSRCSECFLLRHHSKRTVGACDHDIIRFYKTLRETDRAAGLDHVRLDREPLPDLGAADEIDGHADRHQRTGTAHLVAAAVPHRIVCQRCNQASMDEPARVGVRRGQPEP